MADTFGGLAIPTEGPAPGQQAGDASCAMVAGFAQAVLNKHAAAAYNAVVPNTAGLKTVPGGTLVQPVVRKAHTHDPTDEEFSEGDLPAVYCWRVDGAPEYMTEDWLVSKETWTLLYIFQPAPQATRTLVHGLSNAIAKVLIRGIELTRDPSFVWPGDPDPLAKGVPASGSAIKQTVATAATIQTYAGAALDGAVGGAQLALVELANQQQEAGPPFQPAQLPTVTVAGVAGTGTVTFTGLGADGEPRSSQVVLSGTGTFTGNFMLSQVQSIAVPPQSLGGTLTFGLAGFTGLGTNVLWLGDPRVPNPGNPPAIMKLWVEKFKQYPWKLKMLDGSPQRTYPHAVEFTLQAWERLNWDIDTYGQPGVPQGQNPATSVDVQFPRSGTDNSDVIDEALFT